jgi:putative two-component system response regulator
VSQITNDSIRARGRVLVVDDERGPRESLRMILQPLYDVETASDGHEALERMRALAVDCVTLDLNMPGLQGEELMRIVRREFPDVEVVVITGYGSLATAVEGVRYGICDYLQKPFDVVKVNAALARAFSRQRGRRSLAEFLTRLGASVGGEQDVQQILARVEQSPRVQRRVGDLLSDLVTPASGDPELDRARVADFLEVLAESIESQHPFMHGHAQRTSFYAGLLTDRLLLGAKEQEQVRLAGFLHDVGKLGVPTELLIRPGGLAPDERRSVERHPIIGADLLDPLGLPSDVTSAVRHHHEWWDGRGYPDGLYGEQIPLVARILSIADAYDAMSSNRPYRPALAPEEVLRELRRFAGVQFDPDLVKEFLALVEASDVELQLVADVVSTRDESFPTRPGPFPA